MKSKRVLLFGTSERDDVFFKFIKNEEEIRSDNMVVTKIVSNSKCVANIKQDIAVEDFCDFDINGSTDSIDLVIICKSKQCTDDYIFRSIYGFLKIQKSVVNYHELPINLEQILIKFACEQCVDYIPSLPGLEEVNADCFESIDIPVVYVAGLIDDMKQLSSTVKLNDLFKENNYKSGFITFDEYGKMLGGEVISYSKIDFTDLQQIYECFNLSISEYVKKNGLDVLLVEVPSAFFSIYNQNNKNFPLIVLNAICDPDYIIMNVFDNFFEQNTVQEFEEFVKPLLGKAVDAYYITPIVEDIVAYEICEPPKSLTIDHFAEIDMFNSNKKIITDQMENKYEILLHDIENKLSGQ